MIWLFALSFVCAVGTANSQQHTRAENIPAFFKWIKENGGRSNVNLKYDKELGYGLVANKDIDPGSTILEVPQVLLLTTRQATHTLSQFTNWSYPTEPLVLLLLLETMKSSRSFYAPYIAVLPTPADFVDHPLHWLPQLSAHRRHLEHAFRNFLHANKQHHWISPSEQAVDFAAYILAYLRVETRAVLARGHQSPKQFALVPLADFLNHVSDSRQFYNPLKIPGIANEDMYTNYVFTAGSLYAEGVDVFANYGPISSTAYLTTYAIVTDINVHDYISLSTPYDPNNPLSIIAQNQTSRNISQLMQNVRIYPHKWPGAYLRAVRLYVMDYSDLPYLPDILLMRPSSLNNEMKAYKHAISTLENFIQNEMGGCLTTDIELLQDTRTRLTYREKVQVHARLIAKKVASNTIFQLRQKWSEVLSHNTLPQDTPVR